MKIIFPGQSYRASVSASVHPLADAQTSPPQGTPRCLREPTDPQTSCDRVPHLNTHTRLEMTSSISVVSFISYILKATYRENGHVTPQRPLIGPRFHGESGALD